MGEINSRRDSWDVTNWRGRRGDSTVCSGGGRIPLCLQSLIAVGEGNCGAVLKVK